MASVTLEGRVNGSKLEQEMTEALVFDVNRVKVDTMKKKAIRSCGSYDEFRHMVSCANLKTVSRKELESLGTEKRGWSKAGASSKGKTRSRVPSVKTELDVNAPLRSPSTQSEFERDWRRCKEDDTMIKYLSLVGASRFPSLFRIELEPLILGQIIALLARGLDNGALPAVEPAAPSVPETNDGEDSISSCVAENSKCAEEICAIWLEAIAQTGRFSLNVHFLGEASTTVTRQLLDRLQTVEAEDGTRESMKDRVASLRKLYHV